MSLPNTDRILPPPKTPAWKKWGVRLFYFLLGAGFVVGLHFVQEEKELPVFWPRSQTPYEQYLQTLQKAGLDTIGLGKIWVTVGKKALADSIKITLPYQESGYMPADPPQAQGLVISGKAGQVLRVTLQINGQSRPQVFLDLFQVSQNGSGRVLNHMMAADSAQMGFEYALDYTGDYLLRIQPELLQPVFFTLSIILRPSFAFPVAGKGPNAVHSFFGAPRDGGRRKHKGIDIFAPTGTPAIAATNGRVSSVREGGLGGKVVWLRDDHAPQTLYYAHLNKQLVRRGQRVQVGDTLGLVGKTGNARYTPPHLHFGVYRRNRGALDPYPFVNFTDTVPSPARMPLNAPDQFARVNEKGADMYLSPSRKSPVIASIAGQIPVRVQAIKAKWYRATSPEGLTGFIQAKALTAKGKPMREEVTDFPTFLTSAPSMVADTLIKLAPVSHLEIWGRKDSFVWVRTDACAWGWVRL